MENDNGQKALHLAATNGGVAAVELLLQRGAVKDVEDNVKQTPLHLAVRNGNGAVVEALLKRRVYKHTEDTDGNTAFYFAVLKAREIANDLAADAETKEDLLLRASKEGNTEALNLLLEIKANPEVTDTAGKTLLHCAFFNKHHLTAEALKGIIKKQDGDHNTILHTAL